MATSASVSMLRLSILIFLCDHAASLIIPEELPSILSLIYSNIPPIKKGTDSRLGVGFRLGDHADVQVLLELGPQTETDPIGTRESVRRRDLMLAAAMNGELGPLAQIVAKYQTERRIHRELEKLKKFEEKRKKAGTLESNDTENDASSNWLTKWSKEMSKSSGAQVPLRRNSSEKISLNVGDSNQSQQKTRPTAGSEGKLEELKKLYKLESGDNKA
ncbi:hypothetical protein KPH14_009625 [Odynerus spinipes]|uniref:Uncharacterized protein n=1 Tax=Odynerus spinipes TaxID=1348599 RepID=A0AAD9RQV1_9HYME|nr:hypothetical protein KPH14_009625 [Odynerus spinipes]